MSDEEHYVECCEHGKQQATYVCQHIVQSLRDGKPKGFWSSQESLDNPRPDSWCNECEEVVNRVGEWNDESEAFAGVKLLCGACYDRAKDLNFGKPIGEDTTHVSKFSRPLFEQFGFAISELEHAEGKVLGLAGTHSGQTFNKMFNPFATLTGIPVKMRRINV